MSKWYTEFSKATGEWWATDGLNDDGPYATPAEASRAARDRTQLDREAKATRLNAIRKASEKLKQSHPAN